MVAERRTVQTQKNFLSQEKEPSLFFIGILHLRLACLPPCRPFSLPETSGWKQVAFFGSAKGYEDTTPVLGRAPEPARPIDRGPHPADWVTAHPHRGPIVSAQDRSTSTWTASSIYFRTRVGHAEGSNIMLRAIVTLSALHMSASMAPAPQVSKRQLVSPSPSLPAPRAPYLRLEPLATDSKSFVRAQPMALNEVTSEEAYVSSTQKKGAICFAMNISGEEDVHILPISHMPATHPSVWSPGAGTALKAGDPIPVKSCARYRASSSQKECGKGLYVQTAPQLFYAYDYPIKNTGNPGYYGANAASLYPIMDEASNAYLVLTLDKPETAPENDSEFALRVTSKGIPSGVVGVALMDDEEEECGKSVAAYGLCERDKRNTAAWSSTSESGTFYWHWNWLYGDGMALGPLPTKDWSLTLTSLIALGGGVTKLLVGGYVSSRDKVVFEEISMAEFSGGVTLSGMSAEEACKGNSLEKCVLSPCCQYCSGATAATSADGNSSVGTASAEGVGCRPAGSTDTCPGEVVPAGSCLDMCNQFDEDPIECAKAKHCGYCTSKSRCLTGRPGRSCENCDEPFSGTDYANGWPHEGLNATWELPWNWCRERVVVPDTVLYIPAGTFASCSELTSVKIGDSVTEIGERAFKECYTLREVTIGDSVASIGKEAFHSAQTLTSVAIGNSVADIGEYAFYGAYDLTSLTIPDSVVSIGSHAFYSSDKLTAESVSIPPALAGSLNSTVFGQAQAEILWKVRARVGAPAVVVPDSVAKLEPKLFKGCSEIESVTMPDTVTSIGEDAFADCSKLTAVTISDSVHSIGPAAFANCSSLKTVTIGASITHLEQKVFKDCFNLEYMAMPDTVTSIEEDAFSDCTLLTAVHFSNSLISIEGSAFARCGSLATVVLPASVERIELRAFSECYKIATLALNEGLRTIGMDAFHKVTELTSVTIPGSVESMGFQAFSDCSSLTRVTIGDSLSEIAKATFRSCYELTSVTIGDGVQSIAEAAFYNSFELTAVAIPDGVTAIGANAFLNCHKLSAETVTLPSSLKKSCNSNNVFDFELP
jgi:hypothetical protein